MLVGRVACCAIVIDWNVVLVTRATLLNFSLTNLCHRRTNDARERAGPGTAGSGRKAARAVSKRLQQLSWRAVDAKQEADGTCRQGDARLHLRILPKLCMVRRPSFLTSNI